MTDILEIKKNIAPIAQKYGLKRVYLFGSHAKGAATEKSDVDLLVEKGRPLSMLALSGLRLDCMDSLGMDVDLVTTSGIEKDFFDEIHNSEILIYEE